MSVFKEMYNAKPFKSFKYKTTKIKALNVVTYGQKKIITENNKARSQGEIISKCATGNKVKSLSFTALA